MNKEVCEKFENLWDKFPDKLDSSNNYQFQTENFLDGYCGSNSCDTDFEKINGGCLYLFNKIFGTSELFKSVANSNINIVEYIMIWLTYMLNLKNQVGNKTNPIFFYETTINNDKYKNSIPDVTEYKNYKDLIDKKKYFLDMDKKIISNFYEAFKLLCEMYNEFDDKTSYCSKSSEKANKFVKKYDELNKDHSITGNNSYNQLLSTLSKDYDNFKNKYNNTQCSKSSPLPTIEKTKISAQKTVQISEDTSSSSSITTRLFTVLSIFGAIAFFLGISYKVNNKEFKNYFHYIYANINKLYVF
ncbi:putative yir4 protein [Plasmodium yoelii yoelii]|uniref:Yir4 protein n=1 Tax=Plasmodium yoelii yoelii TaxID=73239 RepID=Q7RHZ5_PLAYO|nr:putative yir4 protein [Plasmodium yoelii yoelii]